MKKVLCRSIPVILILSVSFTAVASPAEYRTHLNGFCTWLKNNRDTDSGLPFSHVGDKRFRNWTFTYDAAVTALAYIASDNIPDAEKILDYYIKTPQIWRLGGIIEAVNTTAPHLGEDWSVRSGANIWMGIAGFHLYRKTGKAAYLELAKKIAESAINLQNKTQGHPNLGGIPLGPAGEPNIATDQHFAYDPEKPSYHDVYPTEACLDAVALFHFLFQETGASQYRTAMESAVQWLQKNGYNRQSHRFNRGFEDPTIATDVQSWAISAIGVSGLERFESGAAEMIMAFVEKNCISEASFKKPDGQVVRITGVDFIDKELAGRLNRVPLVSPEWTFQMINACRTLAVDFTRLGALRKAAEYAAMGKTLKADMMILAVEDKGGFAYPYATASNAPIGHENNTPEEGNLSTICTAYAVLAVTGFDPLDSNFGTRIR